MTQATYPARKAETRRVHVSQMRLASTALAIALAVGMLPLSAIAQTPAARQTVQLSRKEVKGLIATASTPAEHERIAAYYRAEAKRLKAQQQIHQEMRAEYLKNPSRYPIPKWPTMGQHCTDLVFYYGKAAEEAVALADLHDQMAKEASGGK